MSDTPTTTSTTTPSLDGVDFNKIIQQAKLENSPMPDVDEPPTTSDMTDTPPIVETPPPSRPTPTESVAPPSKESVDKSNSPSEKPAKHKDGGHLFKPQAVTVEQVWTTPTKWDDNAETLNMPSNFDQEVSRNLLDTPKINLVDSPEGRSWANVLQDGIDLTVAENTFVPSLENPNSDWRQFATYNGQELRGRQPNLGGGAANQVLTGERAVLQIMTHVGTGSIFQVPLWHTGIWLTFKPPLDSELVELNRILVAQKMELGRYTYGLAFSNSIVYTIEHLVDFALRHVYDASIKLDVSNPRTLKDIIVSHDIPSLLWGLASAMYPKGFQYRRACAADPATCNHVIEELINLRKLLWVDRASLTDWQRAHMASWRSASKDMDSLKKYREEMLKLNDYTVKFHEDTPQEMRIILRSPSISEYIDAGYRWVGSIVDLVDKTLAAKNNQAEREKLITQYGQATAMRQYTHWIRSIEFDHQVVEGSEIQRTIEDREAIEKVCDALSGDDAIRNHFLEQVGTYINESTIAVVGIPTYDCPACQSVQESNLVLPHHKNIIPLDVQQTFFALLTQRMQRIAVR